MKKLLSRGLIALAIVCFLSLSFSMQDNSSRNPGDISPKPDIQNPYIQHLKDTQPLHNIPQGPNVRETAQIQLGDYTSSLKGRSILAVDVDNDGRQELVADFGAMGVYVYDPSRTPKWRRISTNDPEFMIAADRNGDGSYEIYANWGSGNGADCWEDGLGWSYFLSGLHSYQLFCSADINNDGKDEFVVKSQYLKTSDYYLSIGILNSSFTYSFNGIYVGNTLDTQAVDFNVVDDELVTSFPDSPKLRCWDLVNHSDWTDNWTSMADVSVEMGDCTKANIDGDAEEEFIVDVLSPIASVGAWIYDHSASPRWTRINAYDISEVRSWPKDVGTNDELVFRISCVAGLWVYSHNDTPKWNRINGLDPEVDGFVEVFNCDSDADWDLAVDFGPTGLWKYDPYGTPKWTSMNGSDPLYMIKANIDDDTDDELIVVFESSPAGIWIWDNGNTPKWQRINGANPDY